MKRILPIVIVGILLSCIGVSSLGVALYFAWPTGGDKKPKHVPFTYKQLKDLEDNPDKASAEIAKVISCFESGEEEICAQAAETLKTVGKKAVDPLKASLADKNSNVRFWSVQTLAHIGPDAAGASKELLACVHDSDSKVRYKAVYALGRLGVKTDGVFDGLVKALEDSDLDVSTEAIAALDALGTPPKEAVPALAKLAQNSGSEPVRHAATSLLGKAGAAAVPSFRDLLKTTKQRQDQHVVFLAVGSLGAEAKSLLPELDLALENQARNGGLIDADLVEVFKKCGPDGANGLATSLKEIDRESIPMLPRQSILKGIGEMRAQAEAKESVPILIELLKKNTPTHPVVEYRHVILETLGDIGVNAKASMPTVESLTQDPVPIVAQEARAALRRMGKVDKK